MATEQPQQPTRPPLVALVYRPAMGCKQYPFGTLDELKAWAARKPYCDEQVNVIVFYNRREVARDLMPAADACGFVSNMIARAQQIEETADSLAKAVLRQAAERDQECAFWFISALSKLSGGRPYMRVDDVLQFACEAMPAAAAEWNDYVANT